MFDDIVFGKGEHYCSAHLILDVNKQISISENSTAFWVSGAFCDTSIILYKSSKEAIKLKKMIDAYQDEKLKNKTLLKMADYLDGLVLQKINVKELRDKIYSIKFKAFEDGKEYKASELREVLGVRKEY